MTFFVLVSFFLVIIGISIILHESGDAGILFWRFIHKKISGISPGLLPPIPSDVSVSAKLLITGYSTSAIGMFIFFSAMNAWCLSRLTTMTPSEIVFNWLSVTEALVLGMLLPAAVLCWAIASNFALGANLLEEIFNKFVDFLVGLGDGMLSALSLSSERLKATKLSLSDIKFERYANPYIQFGKAVVGVTCQAYTMMLMMVLWLNITGYEHLSFHQHGVTIITIVLLFGFGLMLFSNIKQLVGFSIFAMAIVLIFQLLI